MCSSRRCLLACWEAKPLSYTYRTCSTVCTVTGTAQHAQAWQATSCSRKTQQTRNTQQRSPRASACWHQCLAACHSACLNASASTLEFIQQMSSYAQQAASCIYAALWGRGGLEIASTLWQPHIPQRPPSAPCMAPAPPSALAGEALTRQPGGESRPRCPAGSPWGRA